MTYGEFATMRPAALVARDPADVRNVADLLRRRV